MAADAAFYAVEGEDPRRFFRGHVRTLLGLFDRDGWRKCGVKVRGSCYLNVPCDCDNRGAFFLQAQIPRIPPHLVIG